VAVDSPVIAILCYHDISDRPGAPSITISPALLRAQIRSLKAGGWTFLSLSELLAYRDRAGEIPSRSVLLTFDDGYRSFPEKVLPILRDEGVRATLAVVTSFFEHPPADLPPLMSWDQVREADRSGFVEIVSHSHDLHRYVTSNPYRDTDPAVTTRLYKAGENRYENRDEYWNRIREDLRKSRRILRERLGHEVSCLAWPYGEYTAVARRIARDEGFVATLGLDGVAATPGDLGKGYLPRVMVYRGSRIDGRTTDWLRLPRAPVRAAQADLDEVYDPDPATLRRRIHRLKDRILQLGATDVFLQACPDPDGDGHYRAAWFMNHQVAVRADIWSMAAHLLAQSGLRVWIRAPVMNLSWEWEKHPDWRIPVANGKEGTGPKPWYRRLSPDLAGPRKAAVDWFTDIAVYLPIHGILFDDDAFLLEGERLRGSGEGSPDAKSAAIRGMIEEIKAAVLAWRPNCLFARNLYAPAMAREGVHSGFSQDLSQFLRDYDLTVAMAYSRMEGHREDGGDWVESLARRAIREWVPPPGREGEAPPVLLKLQAYDWSEETWVPEKELREQVRGARRAMASDLGIYPVLPESGPVPRGLLGGQAGRDRSERDPYAK